MFINDLLQRRSAGGKQNSGSGRRLATASASERTTILPVTIYDSIVLGAGAVVTKDITEPGIYVGNPARLLLKTRKTEILKLTC
jgi:bifunctional N-acetylglucosamine-1-phosphate-uridyltransferase/glucosamine-1-phosphate-acetyltransferase GlmU-like protein